MNKVSFKPSDLFREDAELIFRTEEKRISEIVPEGRIFHVGSTTIPNLLTKGDVDIVIYIRKDKFSESREKLLTIYKKDVNNEWSETISSFTLKNKKLPVGIHLIAEGNYEDFLIFGDLLIKNPGLIEKYNELKKTYEGKDMIEYRKAKSQFIEEILKRGVEAEIVL